MHKELEVMKPRCKGLWKKCSALIAGMYFRVLSITPLIAKAAGCSLKLKSFVRFETGEGLEKKEEDFAAEVAAQMGN